MYEWTCEFNGRKYNPKQKWNNKRYQCESKKTIKHHICKEDFAWNPSTCAWERDIDCEISEYLKDWACTKSLIDDFVIKCDETGNVI